MPCDTVYTVKVTADISKMDRTILIAAFRRIGWRVLDNTSRLLTIATNRGQITFADGQAEVRRGQEGMVEEIKRMYAEEGLYVKAEANGWDVVVTGPHQFEIIREGAGGWDAR